MGFLDRTKEIGGKKIKLLSPEQLPPEIPEPDDYEPDYEMSFGSPDDDIPDLPLPHETLEFEEKEAFIPKSSNPFGNKPFSEPEGSEIKEIYLPNESFQGINDEDKKRTEEIEKEIESKRKETDILIGENSDGEKISDTSEIKKEIDDEEIEKKKIVCICGVEAVMEDCIEEKAKDNDDESCDTKEARREYSLDAMATVPKITFAKPKEAGSGLKKLLIFLCACIAVGIFLGVKANSYWVASGMSSSGLNCCFAWLMEEGMKTSLSPFSPQVFGTGVAVGAGILGIIGLFVYLESDQKKRSRVGHEHGTGHIAGRKDFKVYKNKFMED